MLNVLIIPVKCTTTAGILNFSAQQDEVYISQQSLITITYYGLLLTTYYRYYYLLLYRNREQVLLYYDLYYSPHTHNTSSLNHIIKNLQIIVSQISSEYKSRNKSKLYSNCTRSTGKQETISNMGLRDHP
jgi:hypothetical protein